MRYAGKGICMAREKLHGTHVPCHVVPFLATAGWRCYGTTLEQAQSQHTALLLQVLLPLHTRTWGGAQLPLPSKHVATWHEP